MKKIFYFIICLQFFAVMSYGQNLEEVNITTLGGTVISPYTDSPPTEPQEMAFDDLVDTKYLTFNPATWLQFETTDDIKYKLTKYSITSANDAAERDPSIVILRGSNDGINWTKIDSLTEVTFDTRFQTLEYIINPTESYCYFKIELETELADMIQIAEVRLFAQIAATGLQTPNAELPKLYANGNILNLSFQSDELRHCTISDISGILVKSFNSTNSTSQTDIKSLPNGIYLLTIQANKGVRTIKFVKN